MADEKMFDVAVYSEQFAEYGDKLNLIRAKSKKVRDYDLIKKEYKSISKSIEKMTEDDGIVKEVRQKYLDILRLSIKELEKDKNVQEYMQVYFSISDILSLLSQSMNDLKKSCPELHAWIALNKKRAYYEDKLSEDASNFKDIEALKETKVAIANFRFLHKDSVDKWEEMYRFGLEFFS